MRRVFLKTYCFLCLTLLCVAIYASYCEGFETTAKDVADYTFTAIALAGVFAYAFNLRVYGRSFWKVYLPFIVLWDAIMLVEPVSDFLSWEEPDGTWIAIIAMLTALIIQIVEYIALFFYGYRSNSLWEAP